MKRARFRILALAAALAFLGPAASRPAHASPPQIRHAMGLFLTPKGQRFFRYSLDEMLLRNGYTLNAGRFSSWTYDAGEPIRLDELPLEYQRFKSSLGKVRDQLRDWLRNFQVGDPLIRAEVSDIRFAVDFKRLAVKVDADATRALRPGGGVALTFEAEAPAIQVTAQRIDARDENNPFLKTFGLDGIWAGMQAGSEPLKVQVPMVLGFDTGGDLDLEVKDVRSNLRDIRLDFDPKLPLRMPQVSIRINGASIPVRQNRVESEILRRKGDLMRALQTYLQELAERELPAAMTDIFNTRVKEPLAEANVMDPPGAKNPLPGDEYQWSLRPESIDLTESHLHLGLRGAVTDPRDPDGGGPDHDRAPRAPRLDLVPLADYDAALSINQDFLNQVLKLSFRRGYFDRIELKDGIVLKLLDAPEFVIDERAETDGARLRLHASYAPTRRKERSVLRKPLAFRLELVLKLARTSDTELSVLMAGIDESTVKPDLSAARRLMPASLLRKLFLDRVRDANAEMRRNPEVLVEGLAIPSQIGGIPLKVTRFQSDPAGHLVLYLVFQRDSVRRAGELAGQVTLDGKKTDLSPTIQVPRIRVSGLRADPGRFVHAFFVSGAETSYGLPGSSLKVRRIANRRRIRVPIDADGVAVIPPTSIERDFRAFNNLVLAITGPETETLYLRNVRPADPSQGSAERISYPSDPLAPSEEALAQLPSSAFASGRIFHASVFKLSASKAKAEDGEPEIRLDAGADLLKSGRR